MGGVGGIVTLNQLWERQMLDPDYEEAGLTYCILPTPDYVAPSLSDAIKGVHFIETTLAAPGNKAVYVHCNAGKGRSAVVVLCWLMKTNGWAPRQAFDWLLAEVRSRNRKIAKR